ncbi:MAG TPA: SMC family ATPase [Blastocatellia bacterium]|nr:SMC family ATPase [Blastocatellia bacterium]
MLIEKVELKNIKPYRERTFTFAPGINVLSGPNGAGKSTVFEAIGFALFGVEANRFIGKAERFVRKGARQGLVRVHFRADDGRCYVVERRAGTNARRQLAEKKPDGTEEVIAVKNDQELQQVLKRILNVTTDTCDLADRFLTVIGPLQNEFLTPFLKRGQPRTDEFDRILGISAWREAYWRSAGLEREAKNVITQKRKLVEEKRAQIADYDQIVADLTRTQAELSQKRKELRTVEEELQRISEEVEALDRAKEELSKLDLQLGKEREQRARLEEVHQAARRRLDDALKAKRVCDASAESYATYRRAEERLRQLREQEREAGALREKVQALDKQIGAERSRIKTEEKSLSERERKVSEERQSLRQQHDSLTKELEALEAEGQRIRIELDACTSFLARGDELPAPSSVRDAAIGYISDLESVEIEIGDLRRRLSCRPTLEALVGEAEALEKRVKELERECADRKARRMHLEEGNQKLARGQCPFFEERCLNLAQRAESPAAFFSERIADITSELDVLSREVDVMNARLREAQAAREEIARLKEVEKQLVHAQQRKERLSKDLDQKLQPYLSGALLENVRRWVESAPSFRDEFCRLVDETEAFEVEDPNDLRQLREAVERFSRQLENLLNRVRGIVEVHRDKLDETVRQVRERYAARSGEQKRIQERIEQLEGENNEIAAGRARLDRDREALDKKIIERDALARELRRFDDLSERIKEQEAILRAHQSGYAEYERNIKAAGQLEQAEREVREAERKITSLNRQIAELEARATALRSGYDEGAYRRALKLQKDLTEQRARLRVEVQNLAAQTDRLGAEKERMEGIRQAIRELETEIERYERTLRFIQDLREHVFKKVSEHLSERFREEVSRIADRIYRAISGSDEELRWGPDYRIELVDFHEGRERVRYDEELSGGEMVNAVVALRLALLQTTGSKIGFFDEPTSHLDEIRRANLAQAFRNLRVGQGELDRPWYDQLFLISHDVSFTEITDQIIYLTGTDPDDGIHIGETEG